MEPHHDQLNLDGDTDDGKSSDLNNHQHHHHHNTDDERSQSHTGDGASPGKIFIGGLARETTSAQFIKHFGKYGEITDSVIMKDRKTGQPRGFGFVTYADASVVDQVIQETHIINGKQVEIKRTIPKGAGGSRDFKTKKIFVGGIPSVVTDDEFKDFFSQYGEVTEHQIMRDHSTNRSRGFGFITFESDQSVDDLLVKGNKLELAGSQVEIKKAEPKRPNQPLPPSKRFNDSRSSYGGGFGDTYGGFGGSSFGGGGGGGGGYRSGGAYGSRVGAYGGYGGGEFGGYGGYGGGSIGAYRGEPSLGYSARYGGGFSRGYDLGGGYGGPGEGYGGYGGGAGGGGYGGGAGGGGYGGAGGGGYGGAGSGGYGGAGGGGYGSSYDTGLGGGGYGGSSGGSVYGSRGGYGGAGGAGGGAGGGSGRYHPYGR